MSTIIVYTDGGARGNPGPAAVAAIIDDGKKTQLSEYIGVATNNQAEYRAVILALQWIVAQLPPPYDLILKLDSELVAKQLQGIYRVKHDGMKPLYAEARSLLNQCQSVSIQPIPREQNTAADKLVNQVLDAQSSSEL